MKIKTQVVAISIVILISGCTTTKNINTEKKGNTFIYNTMCIDNKSKDRHYFKTNSYIELSDLQIYQRVYKEGLKNSLNTDNMTCLQDA